jgi:hypothetical protein
MNEPIGNEPDLSKEKAARSSGCPLKKPFSVLPGIRIHGISTGCRIQGEGQESGIVKGEVICRTGKEINRKSKS